MTKDEFEKKLDSIAEQLTQEARSTPFKSALVDAYQEALDLAVYLRQAIYERDGATTGIKHPDQSKGFKVEEIERLRSALLDIKEWDVGNAYKAIAETGAVSFVLPEAVRRQVQNALGLEN
jgi:hypothetical protein